MNENCTVTIVHLDGTSETLNVIDINEPVWSSCLTPSEYTHRVYEYGITIESLDGNGNKLVRHITHICACEINVFCPC